METSKTISSSLALCMVCLLGLCAWPFSKPLAQAPGGKAAAASLVTYNFETFQKCVKYDSTGKDPQFHTYILFNIHLDQEKLLATYNDGQADLKISFYDSIHGKAEVLPTACCPPFFLGESQDSVNVSNSLASLRYDQDSMIFYVYQEVTMSWTVSEASIEGGLCVILETQDPKTKDYGFRPTGITFQLNVHEGGVVHRNLPIAKSEDIHVPSYQKEFLREKCQ